MIYDICLVFISEFWNKNNTVEDFCSCIKKIFMESYMKYFRIIGICPIGSNNWITKIYVILLLGILDGVCLWSGIKTVSLSSFKLTIFEKYLEMMTHIIPCFLYSNIFLTNFYSLESWNSLFVQIEKFDTKLQIVRCESKTGNVFTTMKILILNLLWIILFVLSIYTWTKQLPLPLSFFIRVHLPREIAFLYIVNIAAFVWKICCELQTRYRFLLEFLKTMLSRKHVLKNYEVEEDLQNFLKLYKLLYNCSKEINFIFGMTILLCLMHTLIIFLENFYWMVFTYVYTGNTDFLLRPFVFLGLSLVSIFSTVEYYLLIFIHWFHMEHLPKYNTRQK